MFRFHGVGGLRSYGLAAVQRHRSFSPIWSWEALGDRGFYRPSLQLTFGHVFSRCREKGCDAGTVGKPQP